MDESWHCAINRSVLSLAEQKGGGSSTNISSREMHLDERLDDSSNIEPLPNNAPSDSALLDNAQGIAIMDCHPNIEQCVSPATIKEQTTWLSSMVFQSMLGLDLLEEL